MKRFSILLAGLLLLTACSPHAVQDVFKDSGSGVNLLEIQIEDQTFDLGQNTNSVLDSMHNAGLVVIDYLDGGQYGAGGKSAIGDQRVSLADADQNQIVYFHGFTSRYMESWSEEPVRKEYGWPQNGVEESVYGFPFRREMNAGVLFNFTSADGLTMSSSLSELSNYLCTGKYGMSMSSTDPDENTHYFMVVVNGQPLDLSPYVAALPASLSEELIKKGSVFVVSSPFYQRPDKDDEKLYTEYTSSQECKNFCAVMNAYYDKIKELNNRAITNLTLIDLAFVGGRLDSAAYYVFKVDAFNPLP